MQSIQTPAPPESPLRSWTPSLALLLGAGIIALVISRQSSEIRRSMDAARDEVSAIRQLLENAPALHTVPSGEVSRVEVETVQRTDVVTKEDLNGLSRQIGALASAISNLALANPAATTTLPTRTPEQFAETINVMRQKVARHVAERDALIPEIDRMRVELGVTPEQEAQLMAQPVPQAQVRPLVNALREWQALERITQGLKIRVAQEELDYERTR